MFLLDEEGDCVFNCIWLSKQGNIFSHCTLKFINTTWQVVG